MTTGHQLDRHVRGDVPRLAEIFRHVLQVISAVSGEKAARHLQHVFLGHQPLVRGECRMDAEHRRESRVILARHAGVGGHHQASDRSEEHTSELQSLRTISYAVFCLKKKKKNQNYSLFVLLYLLSSDKKKKEKY